MSRKTKLLSKMKLRFPRTAHVFRNVVSHGKSWKSQFKNKSTEEIFTQIYQDELWASDESRSGAGSTMSATEELREQLPGLLEELGIRTMLDAPCGDFYWMRTVDLGLDRYIGGDIVGFLIERLSTEFADDPGRDFMQIDLSSDPIPDVDALFCRDCLQHLDVELALSVLDNFRRSNCKYLITTTFPDVKRNFNEFTGGMSTINLQKPPFSLPAPIRVMKDRGSGEAVFRRVLGIWTRDQLVGDER